MVGESWLKTDLIAFFAEIIETTEFHFANFKCQSLLYVGLIKKLSWDKININMGQFLEETVTLKNLVT